MSGVGLFFAGSDDDDHDDRLPIGSTKLDSIPTSSPPPGPQSDSSSSALEGPRFFVESEEEGVPSHASSPGPSKLFFPGDDSDNEIELPPSGDVRRASSVGSISRGPFPRRSRQARSPSPEPPKKKQRLSPDVPPPVPITSKQDTYLGSLVVGNAWSTVKGKGYTQSGDEVLVERDSFDAGPSNRGKGKDRGQKKQLTLTAMMKSRPPNFAKRKPATVVRLTNKAGFGGQTQCFVEPRPLLTCVVRI